MIPGYLVWIKVNGQLFADRRPSDMPYNINKEENKIASHPLTEEEFALPITILMKKFPPPVEKEEDNVKAEDITGA